MQAVTGGRGLILDRIADHRRYSEQAWSLPAVPRRVLILQPHLAVSLSGILQKLIELKPLTGKLEARKKRSPTYNAVHPSHTATADFIRFDLRTQ
jgi:hypothetical protein